MSSQFEQSLSNRGMETSSPTAGQYLISKCWLNWLQMTPVFLTPKNPHFLFPQLSPKKGWFPYASNLTKPLQKVFHLIQYQICPKSVSQSAWLNSNETIARIHEEKVEVSSSYRNRAVFLHLHAINRESGQSFADVLENQSSLCTATVLQMLQ